MPTDRPRAELDARPTGRIKVPDVRYEAIMRYIAANPAFTIKELARRFGVSPGWMAMVLNSDMFIARYQEYMAELDEKVMLPQLVDRIKGAAAHAVERLDEVVERTQDEEVLLRATDILLKAAAPRAPAAGPAVQVNVNQYSIDQRLLAIQEARREVLAEARAAIPPAGGNPFEPPPASALEAGRVEAHPTASLVNVGPEPASNDPPAEVEALLAPSRPPQSE